MASPAASQGTGGCSKGTEDRTQDKGHTAHGRKSLGCREGGGGGGWRSGILVALPVRPGWRGRSGVPRILIVSIIQPRPEEARPPNTETL